MFESIKEFGSTSITIIIIHILDKPIIIFGRGTQTRLIIFDHIVIMSSNRFGK
jgi:hypothetical protein